MTLRSEDKGSQGVSPLTEPLLNQTPTDAAATPLPPPAVASVPIAIEGGVASVKETTETRMVQVLAPATLGEGYVFVAMLSDGRAFQVIVPEGGVTEGQSFSVPYPEAFLATTVVPPSGHWKDGLCDCFSTGICHPMLWLACCCYTIAVSQVMTRMKLNWYARPGTTGEVKRTFKIIVIVTICYIVVSNVLSTLSRSSVVCEDTKGGFRWSCEWENAAGYVFYALYQVLALLWIIFTIYLVMSTRAAVRTKYNIPERNCHGCEDCCCAFWCTCCSVTQMARHTGDYETYRGMCCTPTGLPTHAPIV